MDTFRGTTARDGWGLDGADLVGIGCSSGYDGRQGRLDGEDSMVFLCGLGAVWDWAGGIDFLVNGQCGFGGIGVFPAWNGPRCGIGGSSSVDLLVYGHRTVSVDLWLRMGVVEQQRMAVHFGFLAW